MAPTQALDGVLTFARRKLGPLHAAAIHAQAKPAPKQGTKVLRNTQQQEAEQRNQMPLARGKWLPWAEGIRLQSAGRLEEAAAALRPLLEPAEAALAAEASQVSFISCHVASCLADLGEVDQLHAWHELLDQYREAAAAATLLPRRDCRRHDRALRTLHRRSARPLSVRLIGYTAVAVAMGNFRRHSPLSTTPRATLRRPSESQCMTCVRRLLGRGREVLNSPPSSGWRPLFGTHKLLPLARPRRRRPPPQRKATTRSQQRSVRSAKSLA